MHSSTDRSTLFRVAANALAIVLLLAVLPGAFALAADDAAQEDLSSATAASDAETEAAEAAVEAAVQQEAADAEPAAGDEADEAVETTSQESSATETATAQSQGANTSGPYDSTSDGSPSENGNGDGNANGKPCAGCVGNADDKNPPGQLPDPANDGNKGYECDDNSGVGKTNPAHSGCDTIVPGPAPSIRLVKSGPPTAELDETITYTFQVRNNGDETLTDVHITDPLLSSGAITVTPSTLPVGDTGTATADLTVVESLVQGGRISNTATAHGTGAESGEQVEHSDSHVVTVNEDKLTICHATGQADKFVKITPSVRGVRNGHFGTHHHGGRDIIPPFDHDNDPSTPDKGQNWDAAGQALFAADCVAAPAISLEKTGPTEAEVGETITYEFEVTNTGNRPLSDVHITDPLITDDEIAVADGTLAIDETATATATYTVRAADVNDDNEVPNTATVFGTDPEDEVVTDQASWLVTVPTVPPSLTPDIDLTKSGPARARIGETITYSFVVTNTGEVPLTNVHITDPLIGEDDIAVTPSTLDVDQVGVATATYTVQEEDVTDDDEVPNTATAFGTDARNGSVVEDKASWLVMINRPPAGMTPEIDLVKSGPDTAREGETITYSFTVTNTGNVTLTDVHVTDPLLGGRIAVTPSTLTTTGPNRVGRATATYTITAADAAAGEVLNTAIATGTSPTGDVHDEDDHRVEVPVTPPAPEPGIELIKSGPRSARVGDAITYRFLVRNTGETVLDDVTITDAKLGLSDLPVTPSTLAPGASGTASATYTVTQADGRRGFVFNTAVAGGTPPQGPRITDDDDHRTNVPDQPGPPVVPPGPPLPATGSDAGLQLLAGVLALLIGAGLVRLTGPQVQAATAGGPAWSTRLPAFGARQPGTGSWTTRVDGSSTRRLSGADSPPPVHPGRARGSRRPI